LKFIKNDVDELLKMLDMKLDSEKLSPLVETL